MTPVAEGENAVLQVQVVPSVPHCDRCGAPAKDTDFACAACGTSFVGNPALVATRPAGWPASFGSSDAFVVAQRRECDTAKRALYMALAGIFCFGFGFGFAAIRAGFRARAEIARTPGMTGSMTASLAIVLGALDIFGTALFVSKLHH